MTNLIKERIEWALMQPSPLAAIRYELEYTQEQMARALGVTLSTVQRNERYNRKRMYDIYAYVAVWLVNEK